MKHNRLAVLVVSLVAVCCFASQAAAQLPNYVAVVDVAQLIKKHPEFKAKQEALQAKMLAREAEFKKKQETIVAEERKLAASGLKPNSPEHQKAMDDIASAYADFEKDAKAEQRRFALENSQIMYDTYKDIKATVATFAKAKSIGQVTDFRMFEPDPAIPQTVAEDMDQKLVWFDPVLNITDHIIAQMYISRNLPVPPKDDPKAQTPQTATTQPGQKLQ